ncbi:hypothetical protein SDC9_65895 [bioreactor metagenome]|uniref:Uncharacterized protein n=1 Tax=bioreactor metagenome TaxID=1076179 RepID=A0A644XUP7_9ZZZZ
MQNIFNENRRYLKCGSINFSRRYKGNDKIAAESKRDTVSCGIGFARKRIMIDAVEKEGIGLYDKGNSK